MKIEFLVENVEPFLPIISKIIPVHSQIPILSNVLLEATGQGFYIYATNLELGLKIKIPAKIDEEGSTTVPGKQFIETLSSLPKDKIYISKEKDKLELRCRENKIFFQTIERDEFPNILEEKGRKIHTFSENEMKNIFGKLIFSVSSDDSRPELTGVLISQKQEFIDFVATDGFRLSLKKVKKEKILEEEESLIIPAKLITEAMSLKGETTLYIYEKGNQIIFENKDIVLVGRLINGDFPNYARVIPSSVKTTVTADAVEFLQKLKLASIFARDAANIIKIEVVEGKIKMSAKSSGVGEGEAVMTVEQEGEDNEIAFNIKFLMDVLKNAEDKQITIELSSAVEPAAFKFPEDSSFLHIIMPVRVQEQA